MSLALPTCPNSALADGTSFITIDAPPRLSSPLMVTMPATLTVRTAPFSTSIRKGEPTVSFPLVAVSLSITTSPSPVGGPPATRWYGFMAATLGQLAPNCGAPRRGMIGLLLVPMAIAPFTTWIWGSAASTPLTPLMVFTSDSGRRSRWSPLTPPPGPPPPSLTLNVAFWRTSASVPLKELVKRLLKAELIVSVRTKVPAMKLTPAMMAMAVMMTRTLWPSRFLMVVLNIG